MGRPRKYDYYPRDGRVVIDSRKLRYWRDAREMTRQELAEAADLSVHTIAEYEIGRRCPGHLSFRKLYYALGIGPEDLLFKGSRYTPEEGE
jgi:transcriptional regulator with XRE-family HTH domain